MVRFLLTGSRDLTCRVWSLMPTEGYIPMTLSGHKEAVTACFFSGDGEFAYTIAADCAIFVWQWQADNEDDEEDNDDDDDKEEEEKGAFFIDNTGHSGGSDDVLDAAVSHFGGGGRLPGGLRRRFRRYHPALGRWVLCAKHFLWDQAEQAKKKKKANRKRTANFLGAASGKDDDDDDGGGGGRSGVGLRVRCAELHRSSSLLAVGLSNGTFSLFDMRDALPGQMGYLRGKQRRLLQGGSGGEDARFALRGSEHTLTALHTLSISRSDVGTVAINGGGEWLAFGAAPLGQLLVWEWQSETYVLKQQGHSYDMNAVAFSPDGQ